MTAARHPSDRRRRGAILLVVLALLALFAVIGLSFVLYAESEATASRIYREAATKSTPIEVLQRDAASRSLGQLVWGAVDPTSAFRGHDLARLMYGVDGTVPYNGVGLYHETLTNIPGIPAPGLDRADVINFTAQRIDPTLAGLATWAVVDPEYTRADGTVRTGAAVVNPVNLAADPAFVYIPKNAPYTYPDRNNALVAAVDPNTGRVFVPTAHRPGLFHPTSPSAADDWFGLPGLPPTPGANPNWANVSGRFKLLRPRRADQLTAAEVATLKGLGTWPTETPNAAQIAALSDGGANAVGQFPYPPANADGSRTGDVQNLRFGAGVQRNDSVWLRYLPAAEPAPTFKDKKVEPLVSMLLVPLDGRGNLNMAGNLKSGGTAHAGNMGFGPHEQNLAAILQNPGNAPTLVGTKYRPGTDGTNPAATAPGGTGGAVAGATGVTAKAGPAAPNYSQVDWAGTAAPGWFNLPGVGAAPGLSSSPAITVVTDPNFHPSLWNVFQRPFYQVSDPNLAPPAPNAVPHAYPLTDLKLFAGRYSGSPYDYQNQTFLANANRTPAPNSTPQFAAEFLPTGAGAVANLTRSLVTTFSVSLARPGLGVNYLNQLNDPNSPRLMLVPGVSPVPQLFSPSSLTAPVSPAFQVTGPTGDALSDNKGRLVALDNTRTDTTRQVQNLRAVLGGVNLNRPLTDYRGPNTTESLARMLDTSLAPPNLEVPGVGSTPKPTAIPLLEAVAWTDRQQMAADIFIRLCVATGARIAFDPFIPADNFNLPTTSAKLPYSDNLTRTELSNNVPTPFRRGYVLPQPNGFDTANNVTTYVLALNPVPNPTNPPTPVPQVPVSKAEYDALRWLAQLAANIVDQIDGDDVSTAFVWNPAPKTTGPGTLGGSQPTVLPLPVNGSTDPVPPSVVPLNPNPLTPTARIQPFAAGTNDAPWATSLDTFAPPTRSATPPNAFVFVEERAVFGVEKPRLVLNEQYAEVTNDQRDVGSQTAANDFRVRFWFELLNPSSAEPAKTLLAGPDDAGAVPLVQNGTSVYRIQVFDKGTPVLNQLAKPENVTGGVNNDDPVTANKVPLFPGDPNGSRITTPTNAADPDAGQGRLTSNILPASVITANGAVAPVAFVEANSGVGASNTNVTRNGFAVIGPQLAAATDNFGTDPKAFVPDTTPAPDKPFSMMLQKAVQPTTANATNNEADHLDYYIGKAPASGMADIQANVLNVLAADPNRHVALLRRLANPYLGYDPVTNPYVTVDVAGQIEVNDAIRYGSGTAPDNHTPTPVAQRFATGRVQPFAGYQDFVTTGAPQYQYPSATAAAPTLTLKQTGTVPNSTAELMSFFRHNSQAAAPVSPSVPVTPGGETLLSPFQWLAHLDRPLVNPAELASVTGGPAHLLTRQFAQPVLNNNPAQSAVQPLPPAPPVTVAFHRNTLGAPQINTPGGTPVVVSGPPAGQPGALAAANSPLFRALEVLQTKPWTHGVPAAGRVPGKVNVNMLWDENPLTGRSRVFDAVLDRAATNSPNTFTDADRTAIWQAIKATRSPSWANSGTALAPTLPAYGPAVGTTLDELPAAFPFTSGTLWPDRPVKGFGAGLFAATTTPGGAFRPNANGQADTLLRPRTYDAITAVGNNPGVAAPDGVNLPLFSLTQATRNDTVNSPNAAHPWVQDEPLRKVLNSFTTTSDTYLLLVTVGFFNVIEEPDPANPTGPPVRVLRDEAYDQTPGDLRAQFAAVIDRTGLATDGVNNATQTAQQPWTLELTEAVVAGGPGVPVPAGLLLGATLADANVAYPPNNNAAAGTFNSTAPDTTATAGFGRIMPSITGFAFNPTTSIQTFTVTGNYDGQPLTLTATFNPNLPPASQHIGTFFWLGTGEHAERVEAFFDGSDGGRWSYNPTTGAVRIRVREALRLHEGGSVASNVIFRNPGPQPAKKLTVGQSDPVVRMFVELR